MKPSSAPPFSDIPDPTVPPSSLYEVGKWVNQNLEDSGACLTYTHTHTHTQVNTLECQGAVTSSKGM